VALQDHVRVDIKQIDGFAFIEQFNNDIERIAKYRRPGRFDRVHLGRHHVGNTAPDELLGCSPGTGTVLTCQAAGRYLHHNALVNKVLQALWPTLKFDVPFRVGQYRHKSLRKEPPNYVLDIRGNPVERRFYKQKPGPVKCDGVFRIDQVGQ